MHNRVGGRVHSFEVRRNEAIAIVPLCLIILALAFYPQFGLSKSENTMKVAMYPAAAAGSNAPYALPGRHDRLGSLVPRTAQRGRLLPWRQARSTATQITPQGHPLMSALLIAAAHVKGPHIDWAELSPLLVLAVGALVVLLVGLAGSAVARPGSCRRSRC